MTRLASAAIACACLLIGAGAGHAQTPSPTPPFPTAQTDVAVMLWLKQNTSLGVGKAVVFAPDNVLVISSVEAVPQAATVRRVDFRQEATQIDFVSRTGGRSVRGAAEIDCANGQVRTISVVLYSGTDLRGDQISVQGAEKSWRIPARNTTWADLVQAVCPGRPGPPARSAAPARAPGTPPTPARPALPPKPASNRAPEAAAPPSRQARVEGVLVQIGAFDSHAAGQDAWTKVSRAFPAETAGKRPRIEPVSVKGATMFRTTIEGFPSEAAAHAACAKMSAKGQPCFVRKES